VSLSAVGERERQGERTRHGARTSSEAGERQRYDFNSGEKSCCNSFLDDCLPVKACCISFGLFPFEKSCCNLFLDDCLSVKASRSSF
jgi:hypothetical protein